MESLVELNRLIFDLRQQEKFNEALAVFKEKIHRKFDLQTIASMDMLVANMLHCLRKTGKYREAFDFVNTTLKMHPAKPNHSQTCFELGWCLYYLVKNSSAELASKQIPDYLFYAASFFEDIDPAKEYLLYSLLFQELSKKLMHKGEPVDLLCKIVDHATINVFSADPPISKPRGEIPGREGASDRETFMVRRAKAYLLAERPIDCLAACKEAFDQIKRFHHGNHVWLARTMAMAMQQNGDTQEAIDQMKKIIRSKNDWFLFHELAVLYHVAGNVADTRRALCQAAVSQGHSPYKAGLYEQMGSTYTHLFDEPFTVNMLRLAIATRKSQNWKLTLTLEKFLKTHGCPQTEDNPETFYGKIISHWKKFIVDSATPQNDKNSEGFETTGTITRILNAGSNGDGFITTDDGKSIYFRTNKVKPNNMEIEPGCRVSVFAIARMYNQKEVLNALWVKLKK
jgi:tetratricopeptide (TPR) repeat protein/cold shock CspA family protein